MAYPAPSLAFVERFDALRQRYAQSLPFKAAEIATLWRSLEESPDSPTVDALQQAVHRLSGSAPAYGYEAIGAAAQWLDLQLSEWLSSPADERQPVDALRQSLSLGVRSLFSAFTV